MSCSCCDNSVLIVGSVAFDSVSTPSGEVERALGGAAVYSSVAAGFFCPVRLVGVVGEDFPREHVDFLNNHNVDTSGLQITNGKTFHWKGSYEGDMNQANTIATELNVFQDFHPDLPESYKSSKYVFLANIDPDLQLKVLDQVTDAKLVACDTMNFWISGKRDRLIEVLKRVDIAFLNDAEARQLTNETNITLAAEQIRNMGPKYVVIKKGEHGALMYSNDDTCFSAAPYPLIDVVDPTGAGDSFAGGCMGYLASSGGTTEEDLRRAVVYGSVLASYNIQDFSLDRFRTLTKADIHTRFEQVHRLVTFTLE